MRREPSTKLPGLRDPTGAKADTHSRRVPLVAAAVFVFAVVLFAASFGEQRLYSSGETGLDAGWSVQVRRGRVVASRHHLVSNYISMPSEPGWLNAGGFSYERRRFGNGGAVGGKVMAEHLAVPTYPLPLVSALFLAWLVLRCRQVRTPGRCANCGYDLRATPDRCPECGTEVEAAAVRLITET
jgi:hypothetical protein